MGQNCVAGTTELDEQEGIGLVLYVNSESNLIVWNMSDGTKQGNVVPLTTEYQSMLKSEFENKTGVTIGYVIIHRYTEETIDIESSITINTGDTPTQLTLFRFNVGFNYYCFGKIVPGRLDFVDVLIYGPDSEHYYLANSQGVCTPSTGNIDDSLRHNIQSACEHTIGKPAENVEIEIKTIPIDSEIENWDEYQLFTMS